MKKGARMPLFTGKKIEVRDAQKDDISYIINLENEDYNKHFVFQGTYEEHEEEIELEEYLLGIICEKGTHKKVGYILCHIDNKSKVFELRRVVVEEKSRGIGRDTLENLIKYAFETLNLNRFWLDVYSNHSRGIKLYEGLGLVCEGVLRESYKTDSGYVDQKIYSLLSREYQKIYN